MLNYLITVTVEDFKRNLGQATLEIKRNTKTNKVFFSCGEQTGAVSNKFVENGFEEPVISQVQSDDTGEVFYLMHSRAEGGATRLATL